VGGAEQQVAAELTEQADSLGAGEWAAWLLLTAAVAALVAWGLTELVNRKWLKPLKAKLRAEGSDPGWWWTGMVATIAAGIGCGAGAVTCGLIPLHSPALGALVGLGAGASPAWLVARIKARAKLPGAGD